MYNIKYIIYNLSICPDIYLEIEKYIFFSGSSPIFISLISPFNKFLDKICINTHTDSHVSTPPPAFNLHLQKCIINSSLRLLELLNTILRRNPSSIFLAKKRCLRIKVYYHSFFLDLIINYLFTAFTKTLFIFSLHISPSGLNFKEEETNSPGVSEE